MKSRARMPQSFMQKPSPMPKERGRRKLLLQMAQRRISQRRAKASRGRMEQETADAMDPPNAPNASFAGGVEANDVHQGISTYSNAMGDGTSISSAPSAKSRSKSAKSAKSAKGNTLSSNVADPDPSLSTSASPAPSGSGQAPASGYKIKIKPRQASSQTVPIAASLSQGVEKVSDSLAYASLYATPTSSAIPVANGSGDVGPPAAKRPRLSLHTGGPSSQQNGVGEPAIPKGNGVTSNKKSKSTTNGSTSDKKGKGSSKKKAASSDRPKQSATSAFAAAPAEVGMETPPPLWTNRPLPAPPSASVSPQRQGASAGVSNMGSPLSPAPPEEGSPNANGHAHTELAVSHDFRSALSPSAAIPGRTIYSHSQQ
ncbi:hypothetical protein SCHPADRAFT_324141 [Schizopora paradoxa]|uniref:Uncharacterized protein n=1 Tax=Schizopora paradoxa TaxID=27342 RepID=A0A0H2RQB8_9AGAM|nr:hypothetical protein SCHPADRAFT_324141 [Schizopora paradoxa]